MSLVSGRPVGRAVSFTRSLVRLYRDRDISFLAGSVAYAAFVSLIPLALLVLIAAAAVGGESFRQSVLDLAGQYLTPSALGVIEQSLSGPGSSVGFSIFGLVALLWSVLKVFRTLDKAFSDLYRATGDAGLLAQVRDGVVVLGAMIAAIVAMVALGTVFALAPMNPFGLASLLPGDESLLVRALSVAALVVGLTVAFLPMYYVFPNVDVTVREILPGAVVAAVGWTLLQAAFQAYVSMTSAGQLYGVIGAVILFITWLYFAAVVVLVGAATNVVLSGRERPLQFETSDAARPGGSRNSQEQ